MSFHEEINNLASSLFISQNIPTEEDKDILNCPLGYFMSLDPSTGEPLLEVFQNEQDKQAAVIRRNADPELLLNYENSMPDHFFISEPELDKLYEDLAEQCALEDASNQFGQEIWKTSDDFLLAELQRYERKELLGSLIQNDLSSSYVVEYLTGEIKGESIGYLPQVEKQSFNSKDDTKVPLVKENFVISKPPLASESEIMEKLQALGNEFSFTFQENLDQGAADYLNLVQDNLIQDSYDQISKSEVLPTSKRETRYLLGIDNKQKETNKIEQAIAELTGGSSKPNITEYRKEKRLTALEEQFTDFKRPKGPANELTYQELIDNLEKKGVKMPLIKSITNNNGVRPDGTLYVLFNHLTLETCR